MPSKDEDEAKKLAEAAAAASDRVFRGGPPVAGDGAPKGGSASGRPDWNCPKCGDLQFGRNATCRRCGTPNPSGPPGGKGNRVGDWICPTCSDFQYARNALCRRCGTPNPGGGPTQAGRPGDWQCPTCHDLVFARNPVCRRCQTPNPNQSAGVNPNPTGDLGGLGKGQCRYFATGYCKSGSSCTFLHGDTSAAAANSHNKGDVMEEPWRCPTCAQFVFPHFSTCLNCKTPRPVLVERMASVPQTVHMMSSAVGSMAMGGPLQLEDGGGHNTLQAAAAMAEQQLLSGRRRDRSRSPVDMGPQDGN